MNCECVKDSWMDLTSQSSTSGSTNKAELHAQHLKYYKARVLNKQFRFHFTP